MAFKIGFTAEHTEEVPAKAPKPLSHKISTPHNSVVQVYFAERNMTLAYYNDKFDLHSSDRVYVDGKLKGLLGFVTDVNYNFKIKISDYKKVVGVADIAVHGEFFMAGSHFVTFDRNPLPKSKVITWFKAPENDDDIFVSGSDQSSFGLDNLSGMNVTALVAEHGHAYYMNSRVRYISLDGHSGYAIIEGSKNYEVEFQYHSGEISELVCSCFCSYNCKHEYAAMLQLKETLLFITEHYADKLNSTGYFAAVAKSTLFSFAVDRKETGSFIL